MLQMTGKKFLPFDVVTMLRSDYALDAEESGWITAYPDYHFISYDLVRAICDTASSIQDRKDTRIIIGAKLFDVLVDLQRIARIGIDLRGILDAGVKPRFDSDSSPLLAFLLDPDLSPSHFFEQYRRVAKARGLRRVARSFYHWTRYMSGIVARQPRVDLFSVNDLLLEYVEYRKPICTLRPSPRSTLATIEKPSKLAGEIADVLFLAFQGALPSGLTDSSTIARRVESAARYCIANHVTEAERDLRRLRLCLPWLPVGSVLMSGTPKYYGRLLAALYAELGHRVIRFSHGGERGLFADLHWPIPELTFCDEYYLHGRGEADLVAARISNGSMAHGIRSNTSFKTLGSRRHHEILRQSAERPARPRSGKVMYVPSTYLGERFASCPALYAPDPVNYEWQCWLLAELEGLEYEISVKIHPKGINNDGGPLSNRGCEVIVGRFDPNAYDVDCYLFDFAGTAFMDALASGVGVVLLDHGVRPLDPDGAKLLDARVVRIRCHFDELNRLRVKPDSLAQAIESAIAAPSLDRAAKFVESYFSL